MLFNSAEFLFFFPVVAAVFFLLPHGLRWAFLLGASWYFYAVWRPEYLALVLTSTLVDYAAAIGIERCSGKAGKRRFLLFSLVVNLGLLFVFKYFNFVSETVGELLPAFGLSVAPPYLDVVLPIGISFYTFQTLSYSIDVYRGVRPAERHLGRFALYVAFFPQLVAGPIERSTRLLPQFWQRQHVDLDRIANGLAQVLLGFFKKSVIADRLALLVDAVYASPGDFDGVPLIVATYFFAFQIYCDFSGYSDIALGTARILGFDLMDNFAQPYYATSIREFWQRWHISLSTWFRDYVYIPLGGSQAATSRWVVNVMATFVLSGIWHGANWTFLVWGALHATYYLGSRASRGLRRKTRAAWGLEGWPRLHRAGRSLLTFHLVLFGWIFFRAGSIADARYIVTHLFTNLELRTSYGTGFSRYNLAVAIASLAILEIIHLIQRKNGVMRAIPIRHTYLRWVSYWALFLWVVHFGVRGSKAFIYFQF